MYYYIILHLNHFGENIYLDLWLTLSNVSHVWDPVFEYTVWTTCQIHLNIIIFFLFRWQNIFTLQDRCASFCLHKRKTKRRQSKAGPGSGEDEDDEDVILSYHFWSLQKECTCVSLDQRAVACVMCVRVCDSPMSRLRVRGLHCLCPLQPLSSMSWTCSWLRTNRSSVFTALINYTQTHVKRDLHGYVTDLWWLWLHRVHVEVMTADLIWICIEVKVFQKSGGKFTEQEVVRLI